MRARTPRTVDRARPARLACAVLLLLASSVQAAQTTYPTTAPSKILIVGNSRAGGIKSYLEDLAASAGSPVAVTTRNVNGWTLSDHLGSTATINKIQEDDWDIVLIQGGGLSGQSLDAIITANGSSTMGYMAYFGESVAISEYDDFRDYMSDFAQTVDAPISPGGWAFREVILQDPTFNLWNPDNEHANSRGKYLLACVCYAAIYKQSPVGLAGPAAWGSDVAFLQEAARKVVLDPDPFGPVPGGDPFAAWHITDEIPEPVPPPPDPRCAAAKLKAAGKYAGRLLKCLAKTAQGSSTPIEECSTKALAKLDSSFSSAESRGGCAIEGDVASVETTLSDAVSLVSVALDYEDEDSASQTCASRKLKASSKKIFKSLGCFSKAMKRGKAVDLGCLESAGDKFVASFIKAETTGGCSTMNDAAAVCGVIDQGVADVDVAISPICGDDLAGATEECDGTDDAACPGQCLGSCVCGG